MRRITIVAILLAALVGMTAGSAAAAVPADVFPEVVNQGYYIEPGVPDIDEGALSEVVAAARNGGLRYVVVILDEDPAGGATTFADAVLDRIGDGTVVVLSEGQEGYATTELTRAEADAALSAGFDSGSGDVAFAAAFARSAVQSVAGEPVATTTGAEDGGGGSATGFIILLLVVGGLVAVVVWAVRRQNKRSKQQAAEQMTAARAEIQAQLDAMANDILSLSDRGDLAGAPRARQQYETASATFTAASEKLDSAGSWDDLEKLAVELDEATWQLDVAEAILDGSPEPAKPQKRESMRCFFDPTHPGPFEDAELQTNTAATRVRVCGADADKLRRGQSPEPRYVQVGQERVPAATAPRSRGGGGFGALDAFSILVGGMAASLPQRWGTPQRRSTRSTIGRSTYSLPPSPGSSSASSTRSKPTTRSRGGSSRGRRRRGG